MRQRAAIVYALLSLLCLTFIGWQIAEHHRVIEAARQNLMSRGRAITGTLGLIIRSQRRGGGIISQERLQAALAELIKPGDIESITLLNAENDVVLAAGVPLKEHTAIPAGVTWTADRMLLANLVDLGTNLFPQPDGERRAIVLPDPPPPSQRTNNPWRTNTESTNESGFSRRGSFRNRPPFGRPPWMSEEEYKTVSALKGVHSFIIAIPTRAIDKAASDDLVNRIIIVALALGAAAGGAFAWRTFQKSTDLEGGEFVIPP